VIDPTLVGAIDELPQSHFRGRAFRHLSPKYDPLSGQGARIVGGRWNPPESFSVLYLALDRETTIAEFQRHIERQGVAPEDVLPRLYVEYEVALGDVLDLRDRTARQAVGLTENDPRSDDMSPCRAIGEAAHHAGREAILSASAVGPGLTLAVFIDALSAASYITPGANELWEEFPATRTSPGSRS
jgi:RES domain-containing protein